MKVKELLIALDNWAPKAYQEGYDNAQMITGNPYQEIAGVLVCLDSIESVVDEAINLGCNAIIAHHPILFSGIKSLTGRNYVERTIIKAIKNDIAIIAIHTNLDNVHYGVNKKIAEKIGLENVSILDPKKNTLKKLAVFVPMDYLEKVRSAIFQAGAGNIGNYSECSFSLEGQGTFKGNNQSNPHVGTIGELHFEKEVKLEVVFPSHIESSIIATLKANHPYEEIAFDVHNLSNANSYIGSGMVGTLKEEMDELEFLQQLKSNFNCGVIKYTKLKNKPVKKVAICGGAGVFLLGKAILQNADVFISSDFKYHDYFNADENIVIADIGHYESEQFTIELIADFLKQKFTTFAVHLTNVNTNPVNYL